MQEKMTKIIFYIGAVLILPLLCILFMTDGQAAREGADSFPKAHRDSLDFSSFDTIFIEIHVSPEGVYAVDSNGQEWEYDFSRGIFVRGDESGSTEVIFSGREGIVEIDGDIPEPPDIDKDMKIIQKKIDGLRLGSVIVNRDEHFKGPVIAIGPVIVRGTVEGDVISYKKITITSTGEIQGDARAPEIYQMRGGVITGEKIETDLPKIPEIDLVPSSSFTVLVANISILAALLLTCIITIAVAPKSIGRVKVCLEKSFFKSFLIGLLFWIAFLPLFSLLILTIIGIPVAILALPLGTALAVILGITGLSQLVSERLSGLWNGRGQSQFINVVLGVLILYSLWIIMSLFYASPAGVSQGFATLFLVLAIVGWSIGLTAGIGGVILTRFGSRDCKEGITITIKTDSKPDYFHPPPPPSPPPLNPDEKG